MRHRTFSALICLVKFRTPESVKSGQIKCKLDAKGQRRTCGFVCLRLHLSQCLLKFTLMQMRGGTGSASPFQEF